MPETLNVDGFAGMRDASFEFSELNILIGPQATGKSVCAKLLYYFKSVVGELVRTVGEGGDIRDLKDRLGRKFAEYFPPSSWGTGTFQITYSLGDLHITVKRTRKEKSTVSITYSDLLPELFSVGKDAFEGMSVVSTDERFRVLLRAAEVELRVRDLAKKRIGDPADYKPYYIPAGRSFFANLRSAVFTFLSSNTPIDPFLKEFGSLYELMKGAHGYSPSRTRKSETDFKHINEAIDRVLCGKYVREKDDDVLVMPDGRKVDLLHSSSGQQEALPLALVLSKLVQFNVGTGNGISVFMEEPEAHLFPAAQKQLVELFSLLRNVHPGKLQYIITTHSPYVLSAFNNLIFAGHLSSTGTAEQRARVHGQVSPSLLLYPDRVRAYYLEGGAAKPLHGGEGGILNTQLIDDVSNELGRQFESLLEVM